MIDGSPYGIFEDDLFVRILELEREGAGPVFDLDAVCVGTGVEFRRDWGLRFISDNKDRYGQSQSTMQSFRFKLNPDGRAYALEIEQLRRPKSFNDRIKSAPWTGVWAFIAAIAALIAATPTVLSWFN